LLARLAFLSAALRLPREFKYLFAALWKLDALSL
jgi:hypothetical protein